jgi:four helix bundle protein
VAAITKFEDIQAWHRARGLVREVYTIRVAGRLSKDCGLRDQLYRAAVSSVSNGAEGFAKKSDRDFAHFLDIAKGAVTEMQSLPCVALDVRYIEGNEYKRLRIMTE